MTSLIDRLLDSPLARKVARQEAEERGRARAEHAKALADLEARLAKERPPLDRKLAQAEERLAKTRAEVKDAEAALREARRGHMTVVGGIEGQMERHREALRATAPGIIDQWIAAERRAQERERQSVGGARGIDPTWDGKPTKVLSRLPSFKRRMAARQEAIRAADALRLEPDDAVIEKRLAELRKSLPPIVEEEV